MNQPTTSPALDQGLVRFLKKNGRAAGAGLLIANQHLITCVHVVNTALGLEQGSQPQPTKPVQLDFPHLMTAETDPLRAEVVHWRPIQPDEGGDIAILKLLDPAPAGSHPLRLVLAHDLWKHPCATYGFPETSKSVGGVWADGELRGRIGVTGWIQIIDLKNTGYFVQPGFSGGPVWDETLGGVVGINAFTEQADKKVAYIIPTPSLVAEWPALESQLISPSIDPYEETYLTWVIQRTRRVSLMHIAPDEDSSDQPIDLEAIYTALLTRSSDQETNRSPEREPQKLSALAMLNRHQRLVLLGDAGSGKSTFVNFVGLCLAGARLNQPQINLTTLTTPLPDDDGRLQEEAQPWDQGALLPVRVVLRELVAHFPPSDQPARPDHLWAYLAQAEGMPHQECTAYLQQRLLDEGGLIMLDGLDEVPAANERRVQLKQLIEGLTVAFPRCRILVTSRPYAYENSDAWHLPDFVTTRLDFFSRGQIRRFIDGWYHQVADREFWSADSAQQRADHLKGRIFGSAYLPDLAARPLLLTLICLLHAHHGTELPERRADLYEQTVDLLLHRWEKKQTPPERPEVDPSLSEWLRVDKGQVRQALDELAYKVHHTQGDAPGTANITGQLLRDQLKALADDDPDLREGRLREYLSYRAGILVVLGEDEQGETIFTFPHRTFQEYLAACHLSSSEEFPDNMVNLVYEEVNRWREVALLASAKVAGPKAAPAMLWTIVGTLCEDEVAEETLEPAEMYAALIAGQAIVETANLAKLGRRGKRLVNRVRGWLTQMTTAGNLPVGERVNTGRVLAHLADGRPGVGLWEVG